MSILDNRLLFVHINKSGGGYITESFKQSGNTSCTGYHRTLSGMLGAARSAVLIQPGWYPLRSFETPGQEWFNVRIL